MFAHPAKKIGRQKSDAKWFALLAIMAGLNLGCAASHVSEQFQTSGLFSTDIFATARERSKVLSQRGWLGFTEPEKAAEVMGLHTQSDYQPGKIPVVFVHGLLSDSLTWHEAITALESDPSIGSRYQFWTFRYPTGNSYLVSAAELRKALTAARESLDPQHQDRALDQMVLVGHSMGGLISKLQVTCSEDRIWNSVSNVPIGQLAVTPEDRAELEGTVNFQPLPFIDRVIFIATPHGGATLAGGPIGKLGRKMVEFPEEVQEDFRKFVGDNVNSFKQDTDGMPTSVDHLAANSPVVQASNQLAVRSGVKLHSIIGTGNGIQAFSRGDGVVTRASATLENVLSEKLVRAKHGEVHRSQDAIEEIIRILQGT